MLGGEHRSDEASEFGPEGEEGADTQWEDPVPRDWT